MSLTIIRGTEQAPLDPLRDRRVAVLGYGNQGRAHALNLRDSGLSVTVGARPGGAGRVRASDDGFDVQDLAEAASVGDLVVMALPDELQPRIYQEQVGPALRAGATIGFLHGFTIHYELIHPPESVGVVMVALKGPGATLRMRYEMGQGIPCLLAVHQESPTCDANDLALAWANGLGCARAGIVLTSFAHETETDLFGEQTVLCGGVTWLVLAAFETLVKAGYPPELAYIECCHEVKQIADLIYARGLSGMAEAISNTAEFGEYATGPVVVDEHVRARMGEILEQIRNGDFMRRFRGDIEAGGTWFDAQRKTLANHPIEQAGRTVRSMMPWLETE